ncbi:GNAT family N-acetyltransferase [Streptomyces sp. NPDC059618]|uniref:GNAT family N-acetyltransferase n=1 Tax=Streptomyces sp. NPDC059618 TaxID=3346887 RepID=UPI0036909D1C
MMDQPEVAVVRRPDRSPAADGGLSALLTAYHLRTEAEKGAAVAGVEELPERYRAEISDPETAFADDAVLLAVIGDRTVGCLAVTAPADGICEVKRLWTDPAVRGRGIASGLLGAALARAAEWGASGVRLSVWSWRTGAIALYRRHGFTVTESWDERGQLVCMQRPV